MAFPNGGVALYGKYDGGLGYWGQRYRLRLFYSGGELFREGLQSGCFYLGKAASALPPAPVLFGR